MALVVMVPKEAPTCATSAFSISPLSFPALIHAVFWGFSFPSTPLFLPFSSSSLLICACGISLQAARCMLEQGGDPRWKLYRYKPNSSLWYQSINAPGAWQQLGVSEHGACRLLCTGGSAASPHPTTAFLFRSLLCCSSAHC